MKINKYLLNSSLFIYFIIGFYFSINTGITADEIENLYGWSLNFDAIKNFLGLNDFGYDNLYNYAWR